MPKKVIPPWDPSTLAAVLQSQATDPQQQGALAVELLAYQQAAARGLDRNGIRDAVIDARNAYQQGLTGRPPGDLDLADFLTRSAEVLTAVGTTITMFEKNLPGNGLLPDIGSVFTGLANLGNLALSDPSVKDQIAAGRARAGASYSASVTDAYADQLAGSAAALQGIINRDDTGERMAAARDLWPKIFSNPERPSITSGGCVQDHPEIFNNVHIVVRTDNSVVLNDIDQSRQAVVGQVSQLGVDMHQCFTKVDEQLSVIRTQNTQIAAGVAGIMVFLKNQEQHQEAVQKSQAARDLAIAQVDAFWKAAEADVAAAAAIANLCGDKKLAHDIDRFGKGAIAITKTFIQFSQAMSALTAGLTVVTALGAAAATGNLIGAVTSLIGLIQPEQPKPEEVILQEIGKMEEQLSSISEQLHDGLARIDERLDMIYTAVMGSLSEIATTTDYTYQEVRQLSATLAHQQEQLDELLLELQGFFEANERAELKQDIDTSLGWRASSKVDMPADVFATYAGHFHAWAISLAYDEINQPLTGRDVSLSGAAVELRGALDANISYVDALLHHLALPALTDDDEAQVGTLPNPEAWALATMAFAQLRAEWPQLTTPDDPRVTEMSQRGQDLRRRLASLATRDDLWAPLMHLHEDAVSALAQVLPTLVHDFASKALPQILGFHPGDPEVTTAVDLSKGPDQSFGWALSRATIDHESGGHSVQAPDHLSDLVPARFLLADFLRPASRKLTFVWTCGTSQRVVDHENPHTGASWQETIHFITVGVDALYDGACVGRRNTAIRWQVPPGQTLVDFVVANWKDGKAFRASLSDSQNAPVQVPSPAATDEACRAAAEDGLDDARASLVPYVANELSPTGSCGAIAKRLDGARVLVESMVRLLYPSLRFGDDLVRAILDGEATPKGGTRLVETTTVLIELRDLATKGDVATLNELTSWATQVAGDAGARLGERIGAWQQEVHAGRADLSYPGIDVPLAQLRASSTGVGLFALTQDIWAHPLPSLKSMQGHVHVTRSGVWDPATASAVRQVQLAARDGSRPNLARLRRIIGHRDAGPWGPADRRALQAAVRGIQTGLGVPSDGSWGPRTDAALARVTRAAGFLGGVR